MEMKCFIFDLAITEKFTPFSKSHYISLNLNTVQARYSMCLVLQSRNLSCLISISLFDAMLQFLTIISVLSLPYFGLIIITGKKQRYICSLV